MANQTPQFLYSTIQKLHENFSKRLNYIKLKAQKKLTNVRVFRVASELPSRPKIFYKQNKSGLTKNSDLTMAKKVISP